MVMPLRQVERSTWKLAVLVVLLSVLSSITALAQNMSINNNGDAPDSSAMLDVSSTTSGFLMPRMTQAQKLSIASPGDGLMVIQTDGSEGLYIYDATGGAWNHVLDSVQIVALMQSLGAPDLDSVLAVGNDAGGDSIFNLSALSIGSANGLGDFGIYDSTGSAVINVGVSGTQTTQQSTIHLFSKASDPFGIDANNKLWSLGVRGNTYSSTQVQDNMHIAYWNGAVWKGVMQFDTNGYIGMGGVTNPGQALDISGNMQADSLYVFDGTNAPTVGDVLTSFGTDGRSYWSDPANLGIDFADVLTADSSANGLSARDLGGLSIGTTGLNGLLHIYGGAQEDLTLQTSDNTLSQGIAFQNSGGSYTWNIFREDAGSNNADLVFSGGIINATLSSLDERMRIASSGNVGIGSSNPTSELFVSSSDSTELYINSAGVSDNKTITFGYSSGTNSTGRIRESGTALELSAANGRDITFNVKGSQTGSGLEIGADVEESMRIDGNGNVGIGETSPQASLDVSDIAVVGNIAVGSQSTDQAASNQTGDGFITTPWIYSTAIEASDERGTGSTSIIIGDDNNYSTNDQIHLITSGNSRLMVNSSGNIGIGHSSPSDAVHILSTGGSPRYRAETTGSSYAGFVAENTNGEYFFGVQSTADGNSGEFHIYQNAGSGNSGQRMVIDHSGRMGIGQSNPSHILHVNGTARSSSATWATSSDARAKQNIEPIVSADDLLLKLRPVTFQWTPEYHEGRNLSVDTQYGFISQEVEHVIPEMVSEVTEVVSNDTIQDFKILDKDPLIALLVRSAQEQHLEITELKESNAALQEQLNTLMQMLSLYLDQEEKAALESRLHHSTAQKMDTHE